MLLGKRPRPPIKRTTSMTGITVDIPNVESSSDGSDHHHHQIQIQTQTQNNPHAAVSSEVLPPSSANNHDHQQENLMMMNFGTHHHDHQRYLTAMVSPRNYNNQQLQRERSRSSSNDFMETAHFLKTCGLCRRRLHPAQDIYMYRGDTAFCSFECREQQMKQDERKEKIAAGKNNNNNKEESHKNNAAAESSKKSQTVAAA